MTADDISVLQVALARIETKQDATLAAQADHEGRLRRVERLVWTASGFASAAGAGAGAVVSQLITRHP